MAVHQGISALMKNDLENSLLKITLIRDLLRNTRTFKVVKNTSMQNPVNCVQGIQINSPSFLIDVLSLIVAFSNKS